MEYPSKQRLYGKLAARWGNGLIHLQFMEKWTLPGWVVSLCVYGWFTVVLIWFVAECFVGCGVNPDGYYMALCCRDYANQPIAMLTFYGGWLAMHVFGDQIITLRLLGCFCVLVGVGVPCWDCYKHTGSVRWMIFIATCVMIAVRSQWRSYGWDLGPVMYEGILITLLTSLYNRITVGKVLGTGVFAALTILSRVPTAVVVVPICFVALWVATKGEPQRVVCYLRYACMGIVSFLFTFAACVMVMKGAPGAYLATWIPENIITGHGVNDLHLYLANARNDLRLVAGEIGVAKYAIVSLLVLCLFSRRSRYIPALLLTGYLLYRKLMLPNGVCVPRIAFSAAIILFPFLYNWKSRLLGGKTYLRIDQRKFWTILFFGLVWIIGSDRMILRISYYYVFPLLLVPLYPVRRGMIFWIMLLLTLPSFAYSVGERIKFIRNCKPVEDELPYHKNIFEDRTSDMNLIPCGRVLEHLVREGKSYTTFSKGRYEISYLYEKSKPFRFNEYHYYNMGDYTKALDDFTSTHDAIVMEDCEELYPVEKQISMMRERNFYITALPGSYIVFERIEPRQFLSVADTGK